MKHFDLKSLQQNIFARVYIHPAYKLAYKEDAEEREPTTTIIMNREKERTK